MTEPDQVSTLRAYFREGRRAPGDHPSPEELGAYRGGTLERGRDKEVRVHLVACGECADLLLELAALEASPGDAGNDASELEVAVAWRKQRRRLFPRRRLSWVQHGGWAAAACLTLVVGALSWEVHELRRSGDGVYDPNLPRVIADERGRRGPDAELPTLELEPGRAGLVLLLLEGDQPFATFRAEFTAEDGRSLLVRDGLASIEDLLLVPVTADLLPEGRIRVVVSGLRENGPKHVRDYVFRVRHS